MRSPLPAVLCLATSVLTAQEPHPAIHIAPAAAARPAARKAIYDEQADARKLLAAALEKASRDDKRVLLMYGGNWCGWCHLLHDCFQKNRDIAKVLSNEYELVMVDVGHF